MRHSGKDQMKLQAAVVKVHELSHAILYAYLEYPTTAKITSTEAKQKTVSRCATPHTQYIDQKTLNDFETIIKQLIGLVKEALCKWEWDVFEMREYHIANLLDPLQELVSGHGEDSDFASYAEATDKLMEWLDWDAWHGCGRGCKYDVRFSWAAYTSKTAEMNCAISPCGLHTRCQKTLKADFTWTIHARKVRCMTTGSPRASTGLHASPVNARIHCF
jgi:hypothetical protein